MAKTLLQKAQEVTVTKRGKILIGTEERELAIAWLKGQVTTRQIEEVIGKSASSTYSLLCRALKESYYRQEIKA